MRYIEPEADIFKDLFDTTGDAADAENVAMTLAAMIQLEAPCSPLAHLIAYLHHAIQDIEENFVTTMEAWHDSDPVGYAAYEKWLEANR